MVCSDSVRKHRQLEYTSEQFNLDCKKDKAIWLPHMYMIRAVIHGDINNVLRMCDNESVLEEAKLRTLSGNEFVNSVKERRSIFSPSDEHTLEPDHNQTQINSQSDGNTQQVHSQGTSARGIQAWLFHPNNHQTKQNARQTVNHGETEHEDQSQSLDSDSDFATPPATPARTLKRKVSIKKVQSKEKNKLAKASVNASKLDKFLKLAQQTSQQHMSEQTNTSEQPNPCAKSTKSITEEIEEMMNQHQHQNEETQVIEVAVVHSMFKRLEESFEKKIQQVKEELLKPVQMEVDESSGPTASKLSSLELEGDVMKAAVTKMNGNVDELTEKLSKLELDNYKKMITITGLYTDTEDLDVARRQVDAFFAKYLGINLRIETCYPIGVSNPPSKVVVLQSLREKDQIMRNKNMLKGRKNADGKPYFINNYYAPESLEKRRQSRHMQKVNEEAGEEKVKMVIKGETVTVDGVKYQPKITPPNAQNILEMSVEEVKKIVEMKIDYGPAIEKDENKFTGYAVSVDSIQQIKDAYMKLRLSHPKARHILCAYSIQDGNEKLIDRTGHCDDGEHGASVKLLQILEENNITKKAIFVVRYYSGKKIGTDRFTCICEAAVECIKLNPYNALLNEDQFVHHDEEVSQPEEEVPVKNDDGQESRKKQSRRSYKSQRGRGGNRQNYSKYPPTSHQESRKRGRYTPPEYGYHKRASVDYDYNSDHGLDYYDNYEREYPPLNQWRNTRGGFKYQW